MSVVLFSRGIVTAPPGVTLSGGSGGGGSLTIATSSIASATQDTYFTQTLAATGGTAPYKWEYTSDNAIGLDPGLFIETRTGILRGIPEWPGTYSMRLRVTDAVGATATAALTHVVASAGSLTIKTPASLTPIWSDGTKANPWSQLIDVTGGQAPYTFVLTSGTLPPNITLNDYGVLQSPRYTQPPVAAGTYSFRITVTDYVGATAFKDFTVVSGTSPLTLGYIATISDSQCVYRYDNIQDAVVGQAFSFTLNASGGTAPYTFSKVGGAWPDAAFSISSGGVISGTPTSVGMADVLIRVTDNVGATNDQWVRFGTVAMTQVKAGAKIPYEPCAYVEDVYALPAGNVWTATNTATAGAAGSGAGNRTGCGLQYAIDNCAQGDIIVLTSGATYTYQVTLREHAATPAYIYIIASNFYNNTPVGGTSIPAAGTRITNDPTELTNFAKLRVNLVNTEAVLADLRAHHYRFVGIDFVAPDLTNYGLVSLTTTAIRDLDLPHHIGFDRCHLSGSDNLDVYSIRGIVGNANFLLVTGCWAEKFHGLAGSDSQALWVNAARGPFRVTNNFMSASGENVLFGGSDNGFYKLNPSDAYFNGNFWWKDTAWAQGYIKFNVKNSIEFKMGRRILVDGDIVENNWVQSQFGSTFLANLHNQSGGNPWLYLNDLHFKNVRAMAIQRGLEQLMQDYSFNSNRSQRFAFTNSLLEIGGIWNPVYNSYTAAALPAQGMVDWIWDHMTTLISTPLTAGATMFMRLNMNEPAVSSINGKFARFVITNSISDTGDYNINSDTGDLPGSLSSRASSYLVTNNALVGGSNFPTGNFYPANYAAVTFNNAAAGDYSLGGASSYKGAGMDFSERWITTAGTPDGTDLGADMTEVAPLQYATPTIYTTSFPNGTVGVNYGYQIDADTNVRNYAVSAYGGRPRYTWAVVSGALPPGLVLDATNGAIGGWFTGTITAGTNTMTGVTVPSGLVVGSAVHGYQGFPYGTTVTGISGTTVTMSNNATDSGIYVMMFSCKPTAAGSYTFGVQATDKFGATATKSFTIVVT